MKKILLALLLMFATLLCSAACSNEPPTKEEILAHFDSDEYSKQVYTGAPLEDLLPNLDVGGEIRSVTHLINKKTAAPNLEWVYLYEFSLESEAALAEAEKSKLAAKIENGKCLRFGRLVLYGNSPVLDELN